MNELMTFGVESHGGLKWWTSRCVKSLSATPRTQEKPSHS